MAKSEWVENLRMEIEDAQVPTIPAVPIKKPANNLNVWGVACLIVCTVVLGIAIGLALWQHACGAVAVEYSQPLPVAVDQQPQLQPSPPSDQPDWIALKNTVNSLTEREKALQHKVWMLGVLNNNNFAAVQQMCPNSDLGLVQGNWSVDRIPAKIQLTDDQKQLLGNVPMGSQ